VPKRHRVWDICLASYFNRPTDTENGERVRETRDDCFSQRPDFEMLHHQIANPGSDNQTFRQLFYDGKILADRHRLIRVFGNLIRNAREAMKQKEGNALRFTVKQVDSSARFEVADTGCGIPGEFLPRVFEAFVTHGKTGGTGLGLAISKAVVEAHHGTIAVQSNESGTTFQVDLPLGAAAPNAYV
jgi:signal transduction histidine kinase